MLQKKTQPMSTSGTKKPISVGIADFFTSSMKPPSERLTTSIVMMKVATGAAKENRTTDSVVVPNSDVTLAQDVPRILTKCGHIPEIVAESGMRATYIIALAEAAPFWHTCPSQEDASDPSACSHTCPDLRIDWNWSCAAALQVHKTAVVVKAAIAEKARQHCERLIGKCLVHKRFLPVQCLDSTAGWKGVFSV